MRGSKLTGAAPRLRDRRNRVLENQLFLRSGFHNQGKLVEAFDAAQQLRSIHQIESYGSLLAPREIEKSILNVLWCRL